MNNKVNRNPFSPIANFFGRFNVVIFIVVVAGGLIASIMILNNILQLPYEASNPTGSTGNTVVFDETTITRLNKLKTSDTNATDQILPSGRINPFN